MSAALQDLWPLVQAELRLRLRRLSTVIVLLVTLVLSWMIVIDPRTGMAMMVIHKARTAYESGTVAFGSACIASMLLNLLGFYLVRGRSSLDLRSGCAGILATTPVSNARLLASRWLGSLAYLLLLELALVVGGCVLQLIRGEGPLQPGVYLQTYALMLTPTLMFAASAALLADAWGPLMGRRGDVAYFFVWMAQMAVLPATLDQHEVRLSPLQALDISGLAAAASRVAMLMNTHSVAIGGSPFDPSLPMLHFPEGFWSAGLVALRGASAALAVAVIVPALGLFHRFEPARVRGPVRGQAARRRPWLDRLLRPGQWPARALLWLAPRLGGTLGAWTAELSLILRANPWAVPAWLLIAVLSQVLPADKLAGLLGLACALWGLAISDVAARDASHGTVGLAAAVPGGDEGRFWRQWGVSFGLGLGLTLPAILPAGRPMLAVTVLCGLLMVSALASLLGQTTRGGRSFLALYLFGLFVALQIPTLPWLDVLGFNGSATDASRALAGGAALVILGLATALRRVARYR